MRALISEGEREILGQVRLAEVSQTRGPTTAARQARGTSAAARNDRGPSTAARQAISLPMKSIPTTSSPSLSLFAPLL